MRCDSMQRANLRCSQSGFYDLTSIVIQLGLMFDA